MQKKLYIWRCRTTEKNRDDVPYENRISKKQKKRW